MKRKLKQWWSSISPISTKRAIAFHLDWTHLTQQKYDDIGHPGPGMEQYKNIAGLNRLMGSQPSPFVYFFVTHNL